MNILKNKVLICIISLVLISHVFSEVIKLQNQEQSGINCIHQGGQCKNQSKCDGTIKLGLCSGGVNIQCCIPKPTIPAPKPALRQLSAPISIIKTIQKQAQVQTQTPVPVLKSAQKPVPVLKSAQKPVPVLKSAQKPALVLKPAQKPVQKSVLTPVPVLEANVKPAPAPAPAPVLKSNPKPVYVFNLNQGYAHVPPSNPPATKPPSDTVRKPYIEPTSKHIPVNDENECHIFGGSCINENECKGKGSRAGIVAKCPKDTDVCCILRVDLYRKCHEKNGECILKEDCKGSIITNLCNSKDIQCCVEINNNCTKQGGQCMSPNNVCDGESVSNLCPGNINKCCIPKHDDSKCTSKGGQCLKRKNCRGKMLFGECTGKDMVCCVKETVNECTSKGGKCINRKNCDGKPLSGLCHGGNVCCISDNSENYPSQITIKDKCAKQGGECINKSKKNTCNGNMKSDLCQNAQEICCIKSSQINDDSQCTNQGGKCMSPKSCNGTVINNLCPGDNNNKCCVSSIKNDEQCTSQNGKCMNPGDCNGEIKPGLCPGGEDNKCCISDTSNGNQRSNPIAMILIYLMAMIVNIIF